MSGKGNTSFFETMGGQLLTAGAVIILAILLAVVIYLPDAGSGEKATDPVSLTTDEPGATAVVIPTNKPEAPVIDELFVEAGDDMPSAAAFLKEGFEEHSHSMYYLSDVEGIDTGRPGTHIVELYCGDSYRCLLTVRDTVAPSASVKDVAVFSGAEVTPADFVFDIHDATETTAVFADGTDVTSPGTREIVIILRDASGNETHLRANLTVNVDTQPPVITATAERTVYVGDTVSYRDGLSVTDDYDPNPSVKIDSSGVDLKTPGTYKVIYTATDFAGNTSTFEATVYVKEASRVEYTQEYLTHLVQQKLKQIINQDMDDISKLYYIWEYVASHVSYTGSSDKSDEVHEAVRGLIEQNGDCFTYYVITKAFLTEAGFENMKVVRLGGSTSHYWLLVKLRGEWYHFDTCPRSNKRNPYWYCFLRTDAEMLDFAAEYNNYYNFDTSLYPASGQLRLAEITVNWDTGMRELHIFSEGVEY